MRRAHFIVVLTLLSAAAPVRAQVPTNRHEEVPAGNVPPDFSTLQLDSGQRLELETAIKQHDFKRAETILVKESERDPKSMRSAKLLEFAGGIFFLDGEYLNSIIAWKKADALAPLADSNRFTLAMAYVKLSRRDWARSELEKLAAAQPRNTLYLYWLARLDYDAHNYTAAITQLERVIELDPKMMRAYDTLGLCFDYLGKFDQAIKNYNRAVELNRVQAKPSPWPHLDLAISLVAVNQLGEAEKNLREALRYDGELPQAHYQLGRVLEMQGDHQAAVQSLKQAATLNSSYPEPHYLLGRIYQRMGKSQLAKAEIERFQQLEKPSQPPGPNHAPAPKN
jgi:tetratricopeptide (TPR) repeat protein